MAIASRIITPPMVGVPALTRCVCGPSLRTTWPALSAASRMIRPGPSSSDIASAVSAAMIVRKVMYWNRCRAVKCRAIQSASSSSIDGASGGGGLFFQRRHDLLHAGRTGAFDQAGHTRMQLARERGGQRGLVGVVLAASAEGLGRRRTQRTDREQPLDAGRLRTRADAFV